MGGYTDVFGGQTIFPAQLSLLKLNPLTANLTLEWPVEQALPGSSVFADIIEVTPNAGLALSMPDGRRAAPGQSTLINNIGANTLSIKDNAGNVIGSVASGQVWQFYLEDNTTQAGVWKTFQFGTGASSAVAAALAGAGLKAITTTLNVKVLPVVTNTTPTNIVDGDRAKAFVWNGGVGVFNLPGPAVVGADWFVYIRNAGTGNLTVTPAAGLIDGSATKTFRPNESAIVITDGTNYYTVGYAASATALFDHTSISVAGTGTYVLGSGGAGELNRISYTFTGVLTGDRTVEVPAAAQQYWVFNNTTGAFTLTVKTNAGTGVVVPQGSALILACDGINVVSYEGAPGTGIIPISLGGTGAALVDPNADRILFWDDSAGQFTFLTPGTGLSIVGTTLSALPPAGMILGGGGQAVSNNTLVPVTNLSGITLPVGTYDFDGILVFTCPNPATVGSAVWNIVGNTATISSTDDLVAWFYNSVSGVIKTGDVNAPNAGIMGVGGSNALNASHPVTLPAANAPIFVGIKGHFTVTVAGTVDLQFAQLVTDAGNPLTIGNGSSIRYTKVA